MTYTHTHRHTQNYSVISYDIVYTSKTERKKHPATEKSQQQSTMDTVLFT